MTSLPPLPKLPPRLEDPLSHAVYDLADALTYPVDHRGRVYDVRFLLPVLTYHLARAGVRVHDDLALIKKRRRPPTPGVVEDAVDWVPINTPDSIDDELAGVTIDDVDRLSPAARAELLRRLGAGPAIDESTDLDDRTSWHVETSIHFEDDEGP